MKRCVPREERVEILSKCHSAEYGGHYSHFRTQAKVWSSGFFWPEMHEDTKRYVASCPECQRTGNISQRNYMPLKYNLQIDIFDVWGIDFMGPFKNVSCRPAQRNENKLERWSALCARRRAVGAAPVPALGPHRPPSVRRHGVVHALAIVAGPTATCTRAPRALPLAEPRRLATVACHA
jgi:hypothetical protein